MDIPDGKEQNNSISKASSPEQLDQDSLKLVINKTTIGDFFGLRGFKLEAKDIFEVLGIDTSKPAEWLKKFSDLSKQYENPLLVQIPSLLNSHSFQFEPPPIQEADIPPVTTGRLRPLENQEWQKVNFEFLDNETIAISHPTQKLAPFSAAELGMTDGRSPKTLERTKAWFALVFFAESHGRIESSFTKNPKARDQLASAIKDLRIRLKELFRTTKNPILYSPKHRRWTCNFRIKDSREGGRTPGTADTELTIEELREAYPYNPSLERNDERITDASQDDEV